MANPIRRLVQLVLDRAAARKLEDDARKSLGGVEGAIDRLRTSAARALGALIGLFSGRALLQFAKTAVAAAVDSERSWAKLKGTVEAAGQAFGPVEARLRATADAFQDATVHGDEDFANTLQRLVILTGDYAASLNNVGLVANVAARFFDGDLAPAADLVAKVMNGNISVLQRMGITAKNAQDGLNILAERGFGAAAEEAATFGGQLRQLSNLWGEFQEQLGHAIVTSGEAGNAIDILKSTVRALTQAAVDNRDELQGGFAKAMTGTVEVLDGVYRGVRGVASILGGALFLAIGTLLTPLALLNMGFALLIEGAEKVSRALGFDGAAKALDNFGAKVQGLVAALRAPTTVGLEMLGEGFNQFTERTQTAEDLLSAIRNPSRGTTRPPAFLNTPPKVGKNAVSDEQKKITEALEAFARANKSADAQAALLGERFDLLGAKAAALQTVIKALTEAGIEPTDARLRQFAADLVAIEKAQGTTEFAKGMQRIRDQAMLLGRDFDQAGAEASLLEQRIAELLEDGVDPTNESLRVMGERVQALTIQAGRDNAFRTFEEDMKNLAVAAHLAAGALDENGQPIERSVLALEALQSEAELLQQTLSALTPDDPRWDTLALQLELVRANMGRVQREAKLMADAASLAGQVVGAALAGGIVPFAKAKARENLIHAAEETARGIAAALSIFGAVDAAKHFALAARFATIAGAWGALAKGAGAAGLGGGGGAGSAGGARGAGAAAAAKAEAPGPEITIVLTGPGWNALNPEVQRVVYGAMQQARERYGDNANVRLQLGSR